MKILEYIRRIALTAVVVVSLGLSLVPRSEAAVQPSTGHAGQELSFGGKDGNESHG